MGDPKRHLMRPHHCRAAAQSVGVYVAYWLPLRDIGTWTGAHEVSLPVEENESAGDAEESLRITRPLQPYAFTSNDLVKHIRNINEDSEEAIIPYLGCLWKRRHTIQDDEVFRLCGAAHSCPSCSHFNSSSEIFDVRTTDSATVEVFGDETDPYLPDSVVDTVGTTVWNRIKVWVSTKVLPAPC